MPAAQLSAAHLHEPILPLARPPQVVLAPDQSIDEALRAIRLAASASSIHYFYVVDGDARLVGVVPTRRLLAAEPHHRVGVVTLDGTADRKSTKRLAVKLTARVVGVLEIRDELGWRIDDTHLGVPPVNREVGRDPKAVGPLVG